MLGRSDLHLVAAHDYDNGVEACDARDEGEDAEEGHGQGRDGGRKLENG